ncbi:hypothetical protein [Streptomyces sp. NPDC126514]|uniref:hypothetical protein n=1 Tax=Streptomyces sp. NPDC126514 TaxID=3155210 RepID=UPI0033265AB6
MEYAVHLFCTQEVDGNLMSLDPIHDRYRAEYVRVRALSNTDDFLTNYAQMDKGIAQAVMQEYGSPVFPTGVKAAHAYTMSGEELAAAIDTSKVILFGGGVHYWVIFGYKGNFGTSGPEAVIVQTFNPYNGDVREEVLAQLQGTFTTVGW